MHIYTKEYLSRVCMSVLAQAFPCQMYPAMSYIFHDLKVEINSLFPFLQFVILI